METYTMAGFLKIEWDDYTKLILIQEDGAMIDIVKRFSAIEELNKGCMVQVNWWMSDKPFTMDQAVESLLQKAFGAIDANYSSSFFSGSSWTGSWVNYDTTLSVGGHDLQQELSGHEGKFILMAINIVKQ